MTATDTAGREQAASAMSGFERYLTVWVLLCIVVGIALGQFAPSVFQAIGRMEVAQVAARFGLDPLPKVLGGLLELTQQAAGAPGELRHAPRTEHDEGHDCDRQDLGGADAEHPGNGRAARSRPGPSSGLQEPGPVLTVEAGGEAFDLCLGYGVGVVDHLVGDTGGEKYGDDPVAGGAVLPVTACRTVECVGPGTTESSELEGEFGGQQLDLSAECARGSNGGHAMVSPRESLAYALSSGGGPGA